MEGTNDKFKVEEKTTQQNRASLLESLTFAEVRVSLVEYHLSKRPWNHNRHQPSDDVEIDGRHGKNKSSRKAKGNKEETNEKDGNQKNHGPKQKKS